MSLQERLALRLHRDDGQLGTFLAQGTVERSAQTFAAVVDADSQ